MLCLQFRCKPLGCVITITYICLSRTTHLVIGLLFIWFYVYFVVNRPSPPKHPAFYTSSNGGYQINIEPRDSYVPDNTMNEGSGEPMNAQNLTYGFVIKLYTPTANKTSYCSLVSIIN